MCKAKNLNYPTATPKLPNLSLRMVIERNTGSNLLDLIATWSPKQPTVRPDPCGALLQWMHTAGLPDGLLVPRSLDKVIRDVQA
jgi:hypothetical protein